jgi:hypothetical protein
MPVEDHAVHHKVIEKAGTKYGCHNRQGFNEAYYAPNRFAGTTGHQPIWWLERVRIPFTMSRECRYDMSLRDVKCEECKHRGSGEAYAAKVRENGK